MGAEEDTRESFEDYYLAALKLVREGKFLSIRELGDQLSISKDTAVRITDRLASQGMILKAGRRTQSTGVPAYQGHISLDPGALEVELGRIQKRQVPYWEEKCLVIERTLQDQKTPIAFEQQLLTSSIQLDHRALERLQERYLEPLLFSLGYRLMEAEAQMFLAQMPPAMAYLFQLAQSPVIAQRIQRKQEGQLIWVTERWFHPNHQIQAEFVN